MRASHLGIVSAALALGFGLGACGARSDSGPAWPKSAGRVEVDPDKDGGESLEPQHASHVSAIERTDDPTPVVEKNPEKVDEKVPEKPPEKVDQKKDSPPTGEVQIEVIEVRPEDVQVDR